MGLESALLGALLEPMLPREWGGLEAVTLQGRGSKEKVGVEREIRPGWGEGHPEGSWKRWVGFAECLALVGTKGSSQAHSCLHKEVIPI